jgi:hypothetical protein
MENTEMNTNFENGRPLTDDYKMLENLIINFVKTKKPGDVLDIPEFFRFELLPDRQISYFNYRAGEEQIWELPEKL